jgi:hypothetical protein
MTNKWSRLLVCVVLAALSAMWVVAQDDTSSNSKGEVRTITGCLTKSGSGNEYLLTGTDGSTWEIHANNSVNLADHVGQKVEARGVVAHQKMHNMKEDAKDMGNDAGMKNNINEHGHMKVTSVHKMGESCEQ